MDDNFKKVGAQHYIKWIITSDLSLRFYFLFQDRKEYENKYFLKSHKSKDYVEISSPQILTSLKMIATEIIEITGRIIDGNYTKVINPFDLDNHRMVEGTRIITENPKKGEEVS